MSKPLSTKKKIKIGLLLGSLGLVAIWTNSDVLFGQPLELLPPAGGDAAPAPAVSPAASGPSSQGSSVHQNALGPRNAGEGQVRNPFQTLKEQDPLADQVNAFSDENPDPEMPPGMRAQIILIGGKGQKIASIESRQVEEGDSFFGGKVLSIEPNLVTVGFKGGKRWLIPFGTGGIPAAKSIEGKSNER